MLKIFFKYFVFLLLAENLQGQSSHKLLQKGDVAFQNLDFEKAARQYNDAATKNDKNISKANYNKGVALAKKGDIQAAIVATKNAITTMTDKEQLAMSHYNLGNFYFEQQNYKESVKAFKQSLRINPYDIAAKQNLYLAQKKLSAQEEQKNENQNSKNPPPSNAANSQNNKNDMKNQGNTANSSANIDKDKLLQMIRQKEQQTQQKVNAKQQNSKLPKNGKDW